MSDSTPEDRRRRLGWYFLGLTVLLVAGAVVVVLLTAGPFEDSPPPPPAPPAVSAVPPTPAATPTEAPPAWPAMSALDERIHELFRLRLDGDAAAIRAALPALMEDAARLASEPAPVLPGADARWIARRQEDIAGLARQSGAVAALPDGELLVAADRLVELVEIVMSATDPHHIPVSGGEVPWLKPAPMFAEPTVAPGS